MFMWALAAPAYIRMLAVGISTHHTESVAGAELLVADTGGDHYYVAGLDAQRDARITTHPHRGGAGIDPQDLVRGAVEVMEGKYSVAPAPGPTVGVEKIFEHGRGIF